VSVTSSVPSSSEHERIVASDKEIRTSVSALDLCCPGSIELLISGDCVKASCLRAAAYQRTGALSAVAKQRSQTTCSSRLLRNEGFQATSRLPGAIPKGGILAGARRVKVERSPFVLKPRPRNCTFAGGQASRTREQYLDARSPAIQWPPDCRAGGGPLPRPDVARHCSSRTKTRLFAVNPCGMTHEHTVARTVTSARLREGRASRRAAMGDRLKNSPGIRCENHHEF